MYENAMFLYNDGTQYLFSLTIPGPMSHPPIEQLQVGMYSDMEIFRYIGNIGGIPYYITEMEQPEGERHCDSCNFRKIKE